MRNTVLGILKHIDQYYFIRRQNHLRTFPGYTSFPGGKVDRDESLEQAMIRELNEELSLSVTSNQLQYIGHASAPDFNPYRFKVHYYLIELTNREDFLIDRGEIKEGKWLGIHQFLNEFEAGEHLVIPPMLKICDYLQNSQTSEHDFSLNVQPDLVPVISTLSEVFQIMPRSLTVPPANRTNSFFIGDTLIDPSPMDEGELLRFKNTIKDYKINKIMLTHHHGDHHKYAPLLAREFGIPIFLSKDTENRIKKIQTDYFEDIKLITLSDGDQLTEWKNESVKVMAVPGHDEGHLALYPESKKWFIAGDLFQGIGTVVVGGDEGDMLKYFNSLEKVIELNPRCVIPSHGIALGGVGILKKTLEHRKLREEQILKMLKSGLSLEEILSKIYFDLPEKLLKYARANISSHIDKIKIEGKF